MDFAGLQDPMCGNSVPDGWKLMRLGDLGCVRYGLGQPPEQSADGVPMLRATNVKRGRLVSDGLIRIKREAIPESRNPYLRAGDIIVVRSGAYTGDVAMVTEEWAGSVAGYDLIFSPNPELIPQFCAAVLLSDPIQAFFHGERDRSAQPHLNRQQLQSTAIPLPPLCEQRKIAAVLGLVQGAIEQQERLIALTAELKKALLHKLFTEGLRGEPQKQTEIGPVPQSWEVVQVSDSVSITNGQIDPAAAPFSEMLHVGPENIESGTGRLSNLRTNSELRIHSGNYHFTPDDVLYSKIRPYLNKVALPNFEGTCSADVYPLRAKNHQFVRSFLFQLLLSPQFNKQAISFQDRTGIPKINRAQLGSVLLPKPDKLDQLEIADTLSLCDRRGDVLQQKLRSLTDLFRFLLHQLMTAQIRVHDLDLSAISPTVSKI